MVLGQLSTHTYQLILISLDTREGSISRRKKRGAYPGGRREEHIQEEEEGCQYHVGTLETDDEFTESSVNTGTGLEATQGLGTHTPL